MFFISFITKSIIILNFSRFYISIMSRSIRYSHKHRRDTKSLSSLLLWVLMLNLCDDVTTPTYYWLSPDRWNEGRCCPRHSGADILTEIGYVKFANALEINVQLIHWAPIHSYIKLTIIMFLSSVSFVLFLKNITEAT